MDGVKKPSLSRPSPSFRLSSSSLNMLRLRRVFDLFDKNGDGEITMKELSQALDLLGLVTDPDELTSTIAAYIRPGRAGLEFEDFHDLHRSLGDAIFGDLGDEEVGSDEATVESDLTEAFKVFDEDGDGFISARELHMVLGKLGLAEGREMADIHRMICSVDDNKDGRVDFCEFKHMMQTISIKSS